jgi:hypothetical protein
MGWSLLWAYLADSSSSKRWQRSANTLATLGGTIDDIDQARRQSTRYNASQICEAR